MRRLTLVAGALLLANCLLAAECQYPQPVPVNTGGMPAATGGASSTGGNAATGGLGATGGANPIDAGPGPDAGGSAPEVAIVWPECSKTLKAGPVVKHKLGRRVAPRRMRTVQPWHATGVKVRSVLWAPNCTPELKNTQPCIPFNQGSVGACTGFATAGELSTQPFTLHLTNQDGLNIYHWATVFDSFAGVYPPTDTGSDGDSAQRGAIKLGLSKSFTSADTLADMHAAIQTRPGIFGSNWTSKMFEPDRCGHVEITGPIEGGHEYEYIGFDKENGKEWFRNSWGQWSLNGYFWISSDDVQTLIEDGASADFADLK